ncbi:hypothetical protein BP5796_11938 [Coleophoma crateriformis]|uniref:Acyltransferase 3 domain-containing protein n=1 Tax=Coleophoma crateriformis TaxID=565419 RepID=A0A3D8QC32_9HELO|nr:hypothetical protein BP5796_11938 [Coleophoma crateriformis]
MAIKYGYQALAASEEMDGARCKAILMQILRSSHHYIAPSFLQPRNNPPKRVHATSFLDGMRGVAACIVLLSHYLVDVYPKITFGWDTILGPHEYPKIRQGYGNPPPQPTDIFLQLPVIRVLISGNAMVQLFFVISGFSVSYRMVSLLRSGQQQRLMETVSSACFRRGFRLYLPVCAVMITSELCAYYGYFNSYPSLLANPPPANTARARVGHFINLLSHLLGNDSWPKIDIHGYNPQLWSIPVEFKGSLAIYATIIALMTTREKIRLTIEASIVAYALYLGNTELSLFTTGMLLAELHHRKAERKQRESANALPVKVESTFQYFPPTIRKRFPHWVPQTFWCAAAFLGIYILSQPFNPINTPGYKWLQVYSVSFLFRVNAWNVLGASLLVLAGDNCSIVEHIFTTPVAQYLGKISYASYLLHNTVIYAVRNPVMSWFERVMGVHELGTLVMLASLVCAPVMIWVADLFTRYVDEPSISFAKWLFVKATKDST